MGETASFSDIEACCKCHFVEWLEFPFLVAMRGNDVIYIMAKVEELFVLGGVTAWEYHSPREICFKYLRFINYITIN